MNTSRAKVFCEYCCKYIRTETVRCVSPNKTTKVTLDLCSDCALRFQRYSELALVYAVAQYFSTQGVPEQVLMRDFVQRSAEIIRRIRSEKKEPEHIFDNSKDDFGQLAFQARQIWKVYKTKCETYPPLTIFIESFDRAENPFLQYQQYNHRKIKKAHS